LIDTLKTLSGVSLDEKIQLVPMAKYSKVPYPGRQYSLKNKIAIIYAEGNIVMGKGNVTNIGGNNYAEIIRQLRKDTTIKSIILRVNSPGGNAVASDIMWQELNLASKVKPVVVSMGNYAASGGYYISCPATRIYASPVTLSGSIGVFGLIPNANKLLHDKLGISVESVNTNKYADFPSVYRPMTTYERGVMQKNIEKIYSDFVSKVATGRNMDVSSVDSIGQGRVWTGIRAKKLGLIDEFGGLEDAIIGASELAGVDKYSIKEYPVPEDPYTRIISSLSGNIRMKILNKELGENFSLYKELKEVSEMNGIQARLPYFIDIH
jgi:protease-4